jgi:DNA anti-recombination protein RmuC
MSLPELLFQIASYLLNLLVAIFIIYYLIKLRSKEKTLEKKESSVDTNYHHIVDETLAKERKILDDAASEASHIISQAQHINASSQQTIDHAVTKLIQDTQTDAVKAASDFRNSYATSLQQIAHASLSDFQNITKELQTDLQKQIQEFHNTLLPGMQKQLEEYKQSRMKQAEQTITRVVQQVSQEVLNKSIPFEDHQKLMTDALDKAKKEGMFD